MTQESSTEQVARRSPPTLQSFTLGTYALHTNRKRVPHASDYGTRYLCCTQGHHRQGYLHRQLQLTLSRTLEWGTFEGGDAAPTNRALFMMVHLRTSMKET
uniref:Uncharacterized protein n=1 Tax=Eutreptiella gymnastica TaxID=73025 RepID=A0A7S4LEB8_9EUGL|mmetsp:Transcript_63306/g.104584  ORF Transcript_63306/g.104584 Transcript_63306/m.104584 type:complete len:101 (-) Transcript_63306:3-305(-)